MSEPWDVWAARYALFVLEGCDGAGKTTVASHLAEHHGFRVVHSPRTPEGVDLFDRYRKLIIEAGKLVLDRSFVSELVYGAIFRGGSRLSLAQVIELARLATRRGGVLVHLTASSQCIYERLQRRGGTDALDLPLIGRIQAEYRRAFERVAACVPVLLCSTDSD